MSTGGLATLLHSQPHKFPGLNTIGTVVFIFDLLLFTCLTSAITTRFILFPRAFRKSLRNPAESLFYPCFWLSISTIILGIQAYGVPACGPWLPVVLRIIYWIYVACTFSVAVIQYYFLFTAANLTFHSMTPAWILPVFPVMLSGTIASLIAPDQPPEQRLPIIVAGVTFQGLGILVSMIMYPIYLGHLMTDGLPAIDLRPGMFISVGPPSFTTLALIGMSNALPPNYGFFARHPIAIEVLQTLALFTGCFLWALGFWFFCISVISALGGLPKMAFHLTWWAFVFPNVGFTIATIEIGRGFESEGVLWLGSGMTILIVMTWCFVFFSHVRAVLRHKILWPGRDEDKDA
ncbi:C4-dicarboxylate transporter/malic acid transport protein [Mytilinidion resinicola]|uniref:C4-dicarboxylate transporter/malic acid transport protein n=1 Tax=Mytilinidion resinicola TaxID=574789 RepID=A0A6A6YVI7_9PEZI|nr:C4-dicarboxylate transporter/malic acid transport protein [Mytilinidion resinicola]KAF2812004.1 C4-dicarboxylate transporter/malic acid transport protein [Mytilinidion resinicola]